jgi:hypothetical protein
MGGEVRMHRLRSAFGVIAFLLALGPALVVSAAPAVDQSASNPLAKLGLQSSDFGGPINNPYFPLVPGTTFYYAGLTGGVPATDTFAVTTNVKTILGVPCVEVHDTGYGNGSEEEFTIDWFAQDKQGNVWNFGEYATQILNGVVTGHVGSWQSGQSGALPGIVMEANPKVGDTYHQENAARIAEDAATVLSLTASVTVPYGSFTNALETKDFSYIDTEVEHKLYAKGVGNLRSETAGSIKTDYSNLLIVISS